MKEIVEGNFPLVTMEAILDYWHTNSMVHEIMTYEALQEGRITLDEANARMGMRFFDVKEVK